MDVEELDLNSANFDGFVGGFCSDKLGLTCEEYSMQRTWAPWRPKTSSLSLSKTSLVTVLSVLALKPEVSSWKQQSRTAPPCIRSATNFTPIKYPHLQLLPDAQVTFLAGDGDYWKGVIGLAKGLRRAQSAYPLVVAVLPDVPLDHRNKLLSQGCIVREIEPVDPPENQRGFAMAHYIVNYSKLRIDMGGENVRLITSFLNEISELKFKMQFVEYSKMIYLDGDIQVYDNIDHLFDLPDGHFYAVMDCFCEKSWSGTPQHQIGYCQLSPRKSQWPEEKLGPKPPPYFNAGIARPFKQVIPKVYNYTLLMLWRHPENVELGKVKVVHYTCAGEAKPWRVTGTEEIMDRKEVKMLVDKWWDIYDDVDLDYQHVRDKSFTIPAVTAVNSKPPRVDTVRCAAKVSLFCPLKSGVDMYSFSSFFVITCKCVYMQYKSSTQIMMFSLSLNPHI
ncbi:hypothetical protein LXL04_022116 [Taraxacum kok-saghyz]